MKCPLKKSDPDKLKTLPISAAEQSTRKLYLDDYSLMQCSALLVSAEDLGRDTYCLRLVLDQTCVYPGGGGQACDHQLGAVTVTKIRKKDGKIRASYMLADDAAAGLTDTQTSSI